MTLDLSGLVEAEVLAVVPAEAAEELSPALEAAEAEPFPAAAAEDELEELPESPLLLDEPEAAAAPPSAATAAADEPEDELELLGVVVEDEPSELEAPDPLAPAPAAPPSEAATAATDEVVLEDELEPSPEPALEAPDPELAPAAPAPPSPATTATTEEPVEELLEAAEAKPAENKTANNDNIILFILCIPYYFANVFDQTHRFFLPDYAYFINRNSARNKRFGFGVPAAILARGDSKKLVWGRLLRPRISNYYGAAAPLEPDVPAPAAAPGAAELEDELELAAAAAAP